MDLDKILEDEHVYDLYEQVANKEVSQDLFIKLIKDLVSKLLVVPVQLDKEDIANKLQGVVNDLQQDNVNIDIIINAIDKIYKRVKLARKHSTQLMTIGEKLKYGLIKKKGLDYFTFNYHTALNNLLYKGFIVVGGDASSGKTSFTLDLILDYIESLGDKSKNTYLLLFTLDDSECKIYEQLDLLSYVRFKKVKPSWIKTNIYIERFLYYDTLYTIRQKVQEIKNRGDDVLVWIDYLQIIKIPDDSKMKEYMNKIVYELKALTIDFEIAVITLSQLTRGLDGKYRYRESSEIANQAEMCIDIDKNDKGMFLVDLKKIKRDGTSYYITNVASKYMNFNALEPYVPKKSQWGGKW